MAATIQGAIERSLEPVGIKRSPALTAFASRYVDRATRQFFLGAGSLARVSHGAIDSTMAGVGPLLLTNPTTLGAGATHVNVVGTTARADPDLDGPGMPLVADDQDEFAAELGYHLRTRVASAALAITHGVTDDLDLSLLLLVVDVHLEIDVTRQLARRSGNGGPFLPITSPQVARTAAFHTSGFGDITLRAKYRLPDIGPVHAVTTLEAQFPTGERENLTGQGFYWLTPSLDLSLPFWGNRAVTVLNLDLDYNLGRVDQSQARYGLGVSAAILPGTLAGSVEFLGRSELDTQPNPQASDALYLLADGTVVTRPLFGFGVGRHDYFDLAFGVRVTLPGPFVAFAAGVYALNEVDLHAHQIIPVVGIGARF